MLVLVHDTEEVVPISFLVENRAVVHVIFQHCEAAVLSGVDLSQQGYFLALLLKDLHTIGTHVFEASIIWLSSEGRVRKHLLCIHIALQFACHPEIVHKEWALVDVLEKAEAAIL